MDKTEKKDEIITFDGKSTCDDCGKPFHYQGLPPLSKEHKRHRLCQCHLVNKHNILEFIEEAEFFLNLLILKTPTGDERNELTNANIFLMKAKDSLNAKDEL